MNLICTWKWTQIQTVIGNGFIFLLKTCTKLLSDLTCIDLKKDTHFFREEWNLMFSVLKMEQVGDHVQGKQSIGKKKFNFS